MRHHTCDRCGVVTDVPEPGPDAELEKGMHLILSQRIKRRANPGGNPDSPKLTIRVRRNAQLCGACLDELEEWMKKKDGLSGERDLVVAVLERWAQVECGCGGITPCIHAKTYELLERLRPKGGKTT